MSIEFRRPRADDFRQIELQPCDEYLAPYLQQYAEQIEAVALADPGSLTCVENGRVVGIGGIRQDTGEAWQFFAADCRRSFLAMLSRIRRAAVAYALTHGEVWAMIDPEHPNARRWAALLGFDHVEGEKWSLRSEELVAPSRH